MLSQLPGSREAPQTRTMPLEFAEAPSRGAGHLVTKRKPGLFKLFPLPAPLEELQGVLKIPPAPSEKGR